jgi:hypothetical protein
MILDGGFHKWNNFKMAGYFIENPMKKWMMTGGSSMT